MTARSHSRDRQRDKKKRATALAMNRAKRGEERRDDERERPAGRSAE